MTLEFGVWFEFFCIAVDEDYSHVAYDSVLIGILLPTFRRNLPVTRNLLFFDFP
jgi:hypothetical protein